MVAAPKEIDDLIDRLFKQSRFERNRLTNIHNYIKNRTFDIYVPRQATREFRMLVDQSRFNVLPLLVKVFRQNLCIDGYRPSKSSDNSPVWDEVWQPNRMDARQTGLWKCAIQYGYSFGSVLKGIPGPVVGVYSPRQVIADYENLTDEWPRYVIVIESPLKSDDNWNMQDLSLQPFFPDGYKISLYDNTNRVKLVRERGGWEVREVAEHGMGVCPFVKFWEQYDDPDEDSVGIVEPLLPVQRQLNQTTFSLLMAQQYAAFRQRWVTGMTIEEDVNGVPRIPFNPAVDKVFHAESPDTKFGEFEQSSLDGYLNSRDKVLMFISSLTQIPPNNLMVGTGISNLSAEALASLEAGLRRSTGEFQTSFGESTEQLMRLAGRAMGTTEGLSVWEDQSAQVHWKDTTPRSLAQVADALGKLATMLAIPPRVLWEKLPDVPQQDLERWHIEADKFEAQQAIRQRQMIEASISAKAQAGVKSIGAAKNTAEPAATKE